MKKNCFFVFATLVVLIALSGCTGKTTYGMSNSSSGMPISTVFVNTKGESIGTATLEQQSNGVKISVTVSGLAPGKHGIHFHEIGSCEPPDFKSSGEHFNPKSKEHGLLNPKGPHAGDLPNLVVSKDGKANMEMISSNVTLELGKPNSLIKPGGIALIIHEKEDDQLTNPSGNSGNRIACAVIQEAAGKN